MLLLQLSAPGAIVLWVNEKEAADIMNLKFFLAIFGLLFALSAPAHAEDGVIGLCVEALERAAETGQNPMGTIEVRANRGNGTYTSLIQKREVIASFADPRGGVKCDFGPSDLGGFEITVTGKLFFFSDDPRVSELIQAWQRLGFPLKKLEALTQIE